MKALKYLLIISLLALPVSAAAWWFNNASSAGHAGGATPFVFTILTLGEDDTFTLPLYDGGTYNFNVDWGDSNSDTITTWNDGDNGHTYEDGGATEYTITITGTIVGMAFEGGGDDTQMKDISSWGPFGFGDTGSTFEGCTNLTVSATDAPSLAGVTDMSNTFQTNSSLTTIPGMASWDMSSVVTIYAMFHGASSFNQDISAWDTSSVTNMGYVFYNNTLFNQPLDNWDTGEVTTMTWMFYDAPAINQSLDSWDVSKVTNMDYMFRGADAFDGNITSWTTTALTSTTGMFFSCDVFDQDISGWDMELVDDMSGMFHDAIAFSQDIGAWKTDAVEDISSMFDGAVSFDHDLSAWDISNVDDADEMFLGVTLSTANYDELLEGWEDQADTAVINFGAGNSTYTGGGDAADARAVLVGKGWVITDGGIAP